VVAVLRRFLSFNNTRKEIKIMIFVIMAIFLVIAIAGFVAYVYTDSEGFCVLGVFGSIATAIVIMAAIALGAECINLRTIDSKIAMYEEENTRIEAQIDVAVKEYMAHEKDIMSDASPETPAESETSIVLVSAYPELASDTLVQKQLAVYTSNNEKIKELKEDKINGAAKQWWLYFGGF
jgi:hypothetical protein